MTRLCGKIVIEINLPHLTDQRDCEQLGKFIEKVVTRETGVPPEIRYYD